MKRDAGDILDRWSIAKLKADRIGTEDNKKEFEAFEVAVKDLQDGYNWIQWEQLSKMMYDINDFIWQLESGLKSGKETLKNSVYLLDEVNNPVLAKIGLTTILIRNFNHLRVSLKNIINKMMGEGFQDTKKEHLSA